MKFDELVRISGPTISKPIPASSRSRDRDRTQRLAFKAESTFSGIIRVEGSVSDPNGNLDEAIWFEIGAVHVYYESGTWSYEFDAELSMIRIRVGDNDYWSGVMGTTGNPSTTTDGTASINGVTISIPAGSYPADVAKLINDDPSLSTSVIAEVVDEALFIARKDGLNLTVADTSGSPLADLGITTGTYKSGSVLIHAKR
ncbi:MAG: hypothetical protein D6698_05040 [Gammaproteobacteria bacterium]|nr:MAG: hypothetical protein D6698_05040 [Gammaproteobacteria bacterium]